MTLPDYTSKIVGIIQENALQLQDNYNEQIIITGIKMLGIALISMISAVSIMLLSSDDGNNLSLSSKNLKR